MGLKVKGKGGPSVKVTQRWAELWILNHYTPRYTPPCQKPIRWSGEQIVVLIKRLFTMHMFLEAIHFHSYTVPTL